MTKFPPQVTPPLRFPLLLLLTAMACAAPQPEPKRAEYQPPRPAPAVLIESLSNSGSELAESGSGVSGSPTLETTADTTVETTLETTTAKGTPPAETGSSASATDPESPTAPWMKQTDLSIASVDGEPIMMSELMSLWMSRESRQVWDYLRQIIDAQVGRAEAVQMGITLDPAAVDAAVIDVRMQMEARIEESQPGIGFDRFIRGRFAMDPENYMAGVRRNQARSMLRERVVRTWLLTQEHAQLRVIIVTTEELGDQVQAALDAGRDFAEVATEFSEDESRERGGQMPPVVRTEQLLFSRLAFTTPVGGTSGPIEDNGRLLWINVTGFPTPLAGSWAVLKPSIEASLQRRPLDEYEFMQWKSFVDLKYEVDIDPFLKLVGELPDSLDSPSSPTE